MSIIDGLFPVFISSYARQQYLLTGHRHVCWQVASPVHRVTSVLRAMSSRIINDG